MDFDKYLEALSFNQSRQHLQSHPHVQGAKFGVEIELIVSAVGDDLKSIDFRKLAAVLWDTSFKDEFIAYQDDDERRYDYATFTNYVIDSKQEALDFLVNLRSGEFERDYSLFVIDYWFKKISPIIKNAGFKVLPGDKSAGDTWAIGPDGHDSEQGLPILEIRTSILSQEDMPNLLKVFQGLAKLTQENEEIMATGNTGLHVHVSNPRTKDMFARLAAASQVDEDWIWDVSARHDRNFRHARLNSDRFSTDIGEHGAHDHIVDALLNLSSGQSTIVISNEELGRSLKVTMERNMGVNTISEHPTVEYRYFSSMVMTKDPHKAIQAIEYFIHNTAQLSNKNRIVFRGEKGIVVLTKNPQGMIRIDYVNGDKVPRIPKPNLPTSQLDVNPSQRMPNQSFGSWVKSKK